MKDFFRSAGFKALAAVAAFLVGVMLYAASTNGVATIPAAIAGVVVTPVQTGFSYVVGAVNNFFGSFTDAGQLRTQNAELTSEIEALRSQQADYDEIQRKLALYEQFLDLKEQNPDYQFADARVIARDPSDQFYNFTINIGSLAGVAMNDPVITPAGLVGVVTEVSLNAAKVRTILDPNTQVSAYISSSGDEGVTGGTAELAREETLRIGYLSRDSAAAAGDMVVTSGKGGIYPRGLLVGALTQVSPASDGLTLQATIQPYADIKNLEDVFVLTNFADKNTG